MRRPGRFADSFENAGELLYSKQCVKFYNKGEWNIERFVYNKNRLTPFISAEKSEKEIMIGQRIHIRYDTY